MVKIRYTSRMDPQKLLFVAEHETGEEIMVKFSKTYSFEAHQYYSDRLIAPELFLYKGLVGGWKMVVMEPMDIERCAVYADRHQDCDIPFPQAAQVHTTLENAVETLHSGGFVHGDIHNTNLLVKMDGGSGVLIVDFDWAGKAGEIRYPMHVNRVNVARPEGARGGCFIMPEHDVEMVDIMFR